MIACGPEAIPLLQHQVAHWQEEIRDTKAQIASARHPEYDANCRRYIRACRGAIRRLNGQIHRLRTASP